MASEKVFNFNLVLDSYDYYEEVKEELKNEILKDFSYRKHPAKILLGTEIIELTVGRVLINLLLTKSLMKADIKITKNDLFDNESVTESSLAEYFNKILTQCNKTVDYKTLRQYIADTINEMSDLSGELNVLAGNSVSFRDFVRLYVEEEEFRNITHQKISDRIQFDEVEKKFDDLSDEIFDFFKRHPESDLYPFITSETGINKKQFTQAIGFVGLKPDIDGNVIPVTIKDNYLRGLSDIQAYYINSKGTRKALITNSRMVRKSGYLTRKLSLAMIDRFHDNLIEDCDTKYLVKYVIQSQAKLDQIKGRSYYHIDLNDNTTSEMKLIDTSDESLIGKVIGLRSPVTCADENVCKTCYGHELSEVNSHVNTGLIAVLLLTERLTQRLLSAKHLLTTNTDKVDWNEFLDFFSINMNLIYLNDPDQTIHIMREDIIDDDEDEDEIYTRKIKIMSGKKELHTYYSPTNLYIPDAESLLKGMDKEDTHLVLKNNVLENEPIFTFLVRNNELTKSLNQILDLIESATHENVSTYDAMVNRFTDLLIENGLGFIRSVHAEMIISILIRDKETNERLDFSQESVDGYDIVRVSNAVRYSPLSVSLAFERISEQLVDLNTYEKDRKSFMDDLYK